MTKYPFRSLSRGLKIGALALTLLAPLAVSTIASATTVAAKVVVVTQPSSSATSGVPFVTLPMFQPRVSVESSTGVLVTTASGTMTASVASGAGTLSGTTSVAISNGSATFTNLVITGAAGSYTLRFSYGTFSVVSGVIAVVVPQATVVAYSASGVVGTPVTLVATGGSGTGVYEFGLNFGSSATGCRITGSTISATSTGTCLVDAYRAPSAGYAYTEARNIATITFTA